MKTAVLMMALPLLLLSARASPKPAKPTSLLTLRGHTDAVDGVKFSPDGMRLATASADKTAAIWDAATGRRLFVLTGHLNWVRGLAYSSDGTRVATGGGDGAVKIWDTATGRVTRTQEMDVCVFAVAFSPDGNSLAGVGLALRRGGGHDGEVRVWDTQTGERKAVLRGPCGVPLSLAYTPDGRRLALGDESGDITIWELATGHASLTLRGQKNAVSSLMFSPDGRRLASAYWEDGQIVLYDLSSSGKPLALKGTSPGALGLAFSPDGKLLASTANPGEFKKGSCPGGVVRLWDCSTGEVKAVLRGTEREKCVSGLSFCPDGSCLATAHGDGTVKVWSVAQLLRQAGSSK